MTISAEDLQSNVVVLQRSIGLASVCGHPGIRANSETAVKRSVSCLSEKRRWK